MSAGFQAGIHVRRHLAGAVGWKPTTLNAAEPTRLNAAETAALVKPPGRRRS